MNYAFVTHRGWTAYYIRQRAVIFQKHGGKQMKIVVWKSPKMLSGILRMIFGIRKGE